MTTCQLSVALAMLSFMQLACRTNEEEKVSVSTLSVQHCRFEQMKLCGYVAHVCGTK